MEDGPTGTKLPAASLSAPNEKTCDCSCRRGLLCARKQAANAATAALEKRAAIGIIVQDSAQHRTAGASP
jgi:hypothetical protein